MLFCIGHNRNKNLITKQLRLKMKEPFFPIDLNIDFDASAARLEELKANRHVDDIPITDEYWKALKKHQAAFQEHARQPVYGQPR